MRWPGLPSKPHAAADRARLAGLAWRPRAPDLRHRARAATALLLLAGRVVSTTPLLLFTARRAAPALFDARHAPVPRADAAIPDRGVALRRSRSPAPTRSPSPRSGRRSLLYVIALVRAPRLPPAARMRERSGARSLLDAVKRILLLGRCACCWPLRDSLSVTIPTARRNIPANIRRHPYPAERTLSAASPIRRTAVSPAVSVPSGALPVRSRLSARSNCAARSQRRATGGRG